MDPPHYKIKKLNKNKENQDQIEKLERKIKRLDKRDYEKIIKLFDLFGLPYVRAEYEADALCSKLSNEGVVISCLSDDMDLLPLGCESTIKFDKGKILEYEFSDILERLEITHDQFIDLCIMFGTGYLKHNMKIDCDHVYELIKKHGSFLNILQNDTDSVFNMNNEEIKVIGENYYRIFNIYKKSPSREKISKKLFRFHYIESNLEPIKNFLLEIMSGEPTELIENNLHKLEYIDHTLFDRSRLSL